MLQKATHVTIAPFLWFPPFQRRVMTPINWPVRPNVMKHWFKKKTQNKARRYSKRQHGGVPLDGALIKGRT